MKKITAIYGTTYKDLEKENKQLEDLLHKANDEVISYTNCCIDLKEKIDKAIEYIKNEISLIDKDLIECELTYVEKWNFENARDKYVSVLEILGDKE